MLRLVPTEKPLPQLRALAASGSTRFAKRAQAELQARTAEQLRKELGR